MTEREQLVADLKTAEAWCEDYLICNLLARAIVALSEQGEPIAWVDSELLPGIKEFGCMAWLGTKSDHTGRDVPLYLTAPQPLQGWVKESTPEMRAAGYDWLVKHSTVQIGTSTIGGLFSAMIKAAQEK